MTSHDHASALAIAPSKLALHADEQMTLAAVVPPKFVPVIGTYDFASEIKLQVMLEIEKRFADTAHLESFIVVEFHRKQKAVSVTLPATVMTKLGDTWQVTATMDSDSATLDFHDLDLADKGTAGTKTMNAGHLKIKMLTGTMASIEEEITGTFRSAGFKITKYNPMNEHDNTTKYIEFDIEQPAEISAIKSFKVGPTEKTVIEFTPFKAFLEHHELHNECLKTQKRAQWHSNRITSFYCQCVDRTKGAGSSSGVKKLSPIEKRKLQQRR